MEPRYLEGSIIIQMLPIIVEHQLNPFSLFENNISPGDNSCQEDKKVNTMCGNTWTDLGGGRSSTICDTGISLPGLLIVACNCG